MGTLSLIIGWELNLREVVFKLILMVDRWGISCEMSLNLTDGGFNIGLSNVLVMLYDVKQCWG